MNGTSDPNDPGKGFWNGGLFENTSPYVRDALEKFQPGQTQEEYNAAHQPVILPPGTKSNPDCPQDEEDDFDKALKEMLDEEAPQGEGGSADQEAPEYSEEDCPSCRGTGKVPVTENGDLVVDGPLDYSHPEAPTHDQQKSLAEYKWNEEQKSVQDDIERIRKEYGA